MSEENNPKPIVGLLGSNRIGRTAFIEEMIKQAKARGMKVYRYKPSTNDLILPDESYPSFRREVPPALIKAMQTEQLSQVGRLKWWEIKGWILTFKKR